GVAGGAGAPVVAGPGGHLAVGAQLAERNAVRRLQDAPGEAAGEGPVDADVEPTAAALEVLVELAPDLVEPGPDLDDARRDAAGEVVHHRVGALVGVGEANEPALGGGREQGAERRVDRR